MSPSTLHVAGRAALAVLATAAAASPAHAAITAPVRISPSDVRVQETAIPAAGHRTAVVMAGRTRGPAPRSGIWARLGQGTHLGRTQRVTVSSGFALRVAMGADGTAIAAWMSGGGRRTVLYAIAPPGKPFSAAHTLPGSGPVTLGGLAIGPRGRAVIVANTYAAGYAADLFARASIREPGGRFGAPQTLGLSRQDVPVATVAADGTLVAAWFDGPAPPLPPPAPAPSTDGFVRASVLRPGARRFGPPTVLATLRLGTLDVQAASGPGGAVVAWREGDVKRVVPVAAGGAFGSAESFPAPPLPVEGYSDQLAIGLPATGPWFGLWQEVQGRSGDVFRETSSIVRISRRPRGGTFQPGTRLSSRGARAGQPRIAALRDRVIAAWGQTTGSATPRVCIAVRGAREARRCVEAPRNDPGRIAVAASRTYGVVTWLVDVDSIGAGRAVMATYRP